MKKLLIVDDHRLFAEGIQFLIESALDYEVVGVLQKGREVIPFLDRTPIDMLILDIDLPDMSGFDLAKTVRCAHPDTKVLALSMLSDRQSVSRMMQAGTAGYCVKSAGRSELFTAIQTINEGAAYFPIDYFNPYTGQKYSAESYSLTGRETEVAELVAEGITTKQIAAQLFLSARTVETHRKNIYRKLGVHTNVELTRYARSNHLI